MEESAKPVLGTVGMYTLGCRVNQYESQAIAEALLRGGAVLGSFEEPCDIYILNTCAVTAESVRKSRQMLRRAHIENPAAAILVTGCAAQLEQERLTEIGGVCFVTGNREKLEVAREALRRLRAGKEEASSASPVTFGSFSLAEAPFEPMRITGSDRARAYVKIEDGCNGKCAYCIIPKLRGRVRSKPLADVVEEVRTLGENGYREVVLTGIETSAYQYGLDNLLTMLCDLPAPDRIRLGSLNPAALRPAWVRRIAGLPLVMPHFHLSLQSGCDAVLQRMRRGYTTEVVRSAVRSLREAMPDVQLSADVIAGFPGETEEEFRQTEDFLREIGFLHLHVFPYSPRPGTEAAEMPDPVAEEVKSERVKRLTALDLSMRQLQIAPYLAPEADTLPVLFETHRDGVATGHTPNFIEVSVRTERDLRGELLPVKLQISTPEGAEGVLSPGGV